MMISKFNDYINENKAPSIDELVYTLTREDIDDYLLPLTDTGFEVSISTCLVDENFRSMKYDAYSSSRTHEQWLQSIRNKLREGNLYGSYLIKLGKKKDNFGETKPIKRVKLARTRGDIKLYRTLLNEFFQIAKRSAHIEWDINPPEKHAYDTEFRWDRYDDTAELFVVCKANTNMELDSFMKEQYDNNYRNTYIKYIKKAITEITNKLTPAVKKALIGGYQLDQKETMMDGKLYLFFKKANKSAITKTMDNIGTNHWFDIVTGLEDSKIEYKPIPKDNGYIQGLIKDRFLYTSDVDWMIEISFDSDKLKAKVKLEVDKTH